MTRPGEVVVHRSSVRFRVVAGEAVVVQQERGEVMVLNEVGARIIELTARPIPVVELVERIDEEYEVDRATLEADVGELLDQLLEAGVLEQVPSRERDSTAK